MNGQAAAAAAVAAAEASAAAGIVPARTAYQLTYSMIKNNQGALSFPLIALSFAAITSGLVAYVATQTAATVTSNAVPAGFKQATLSCQATFEAALRRVQSGTK